jgi:Ca-activated chloride channel family protein
MMATDNLDITEERLTAYALGELPEGERVAVETHLASNADARREVEGVRAAAQLLSSELAKDSTAGLSAGHRAAIERRRAAAAAPAKPRVRQRRWLVGGVAVAASAALVFGTAWYLHPPLNRAREYYAYDSSPSPTSNTQKDLVGGGGVRKLPASGSPSATRPNKLYSDGHVEYQDTPFTGMQRNQTDGRTGWRDQIYKSAGGQAEPQDNLDTVLLPTDDAAAGEAPPLYLRARQPDGGPNTEAYDRIVDNGFVRVADQPLSTFSIDVDTASYSNVRRYLSSGALPPKDAVRIEEMVNYFPYRYAPPAAGDTTPFAAYVEVAGCPWASNHRLVRIGLKGREIAHDKRPPSNLVFLIDVSGSMEPENKLPLVKQGLRMLVRELNENDRVAIVVYAGSSGVLLPTTTGDQKGTLLGAVDALGAGGSTNGAGGIERAYDLAVQNFRKGGVNRVLLCTDGDFNVGITDPGALTRLIEDKAKTGVFLSVLGFGMGNLKDATMEKLADKGNGNYAYVDNVNEARKVLVEQMSGTLVTIAKDVKTQVEFNPAKVSAYRLVGYENRLLAREDFNDDTKDAGEIGAGHTVTALYEVVPAGAGAGVADVTRPKVDAMKYQKKSAPAPAADANDELLTVKLRYKEPDGKTSRLLEFPLTDGGASYAKASEDFKFAASVAAFGMILRDSPHKGTATLGAVLELAQEGLGPDEGGYRAEFLTLVQKAQAIRDAR